MNFPARTTSRGATAAAAVASAVAYPFLPPSVPIHFDLDGRPDRYGSRPQSTVLTPVIMVGIRVLNDRFGAWPGDRDRDDRNSGARARDEAIALTELGLLALHLGSLSSAAGLPLDMRVVNRGVQGMLLVALGNVLPTLPRNGLIGIRTPWTLADATVWERTHRVGGYLVAAAGLATLASLPAHGRRAARLPMMATLTAVALSTAYSLVVYRRRSRQERS